MGCHSKIIQPEAYYKISKSEINEFPFQVLSATNVTSRIRGEIKDLDEVNNLDELTLSSGHLILTHASGKFLEFEGDTTISISRLNDHLISSLNIDLQNYRPEIKFLYDTAFENFGMHDGVYAYPIYITNFNGDVISINEGESLCLRWDVFGSEVKEYQLSIRTIFNDTLDLIKTNQKSYTTDFSEYNNTLNLYIIQVRDIEDPEVRSQDFGVQFTKRKFWFPHECDFTSAIEALEMAYHMDRYYYMVLPSEYYFKLATRLSDQPVYQEIYENYKLRRRHLE